MEQRGVRDRTSRAFRLADSAALLECDEMRGGSSSNAGWNPKGPLLTRPCRYSPHAGVGDSWLPALLR